MRPRARPDTRVFVNNRACCGCHWTRTKEYGDVLKECIFHRQVTDASYRKFERKRKHG